MSWKDEQLAYVEQLETDALQKILKARESVNALSGLLSTNKVINQAVGDSLDAIQLNTEYLRDDLRRLRS